MAGGGGEASNRGLKFPVEFLEFPLRAGQLVNYRPCGARRFAIPRWRMADKCTSTKAAQQLSNVSRDGAAVWRKAQWARQDGGCRPFL